MNKPTIIFFDIDGTLLDFGKKDLSPKTREQLLKLRENGIPHLHRHRAEHLWRCRNLQAWSLTRI